MSQPPRVLTERDYQTLKDAMFQQQREIATLKNTLAAYGMRRHQGVYMPPRKPLTFEAIATGQQGISETETEFTLDNWSEDPAGQEYFTLASNIVTAHKSGYFHIQMDGECTTQLVRNNFAIVEFRIEGRETSGDSWGSIGSPGNWTVAWYHPDVAIGGSGSHSLRWSVDDLTPNYFIEAGNEFRVVTQIEDAVTTATGGALAGFRIRFFR